MIRDWEAGAVVVGVDGKSADALDWAAAEAATRGCPLIVVHAFYPRFLVDPCSLLPVTDGAVTIRPGAEQVLGRAVNRARSVASELEVLAQLAPGAPAEVLLDQSRQASLLVLGGRRPHALQCLGAPSVSGRVAPGARCPVVVVRERGQVRSGTSRPRAGVESTPQDRLLRRSASRFTRRPSARFPCRLCMPGTMKRPVT
jgi:nucleotide-binding universal stress UspA family protein